MCSSIKVENSICWREIVRPFPVYIPGVQIYVGFFRRFWGIEFRTICFDFHRSLCRNLQLHCHATYFVNKTKKIFDEFVLTVFLRRIHNHLSNQFIQVCCGNFKDYWSFIFIKDSVLFLGTSKKKAILCEKHGNYRDRELNIIFCVKSKKQRIICWPLNLWNSWWKSRETAFTS